VLDLDPVRTFPYREKDANLVGRDTTIFEGGWGIFTTESTEDTEKTRGKGE
jgi:hypothetical protein